MLKKIMFIGAGPYQIKGIEKAKQMGLFVIATDGDPKAPGLKIADVFYPIDVKDGKASLAIAKKHKIDGVLAIASEVSIRTVAFISQALNLPGINVQVAKKSTDKELMRKAFYRYKVPSPQSCAVYNYSELLNRAGVIGFPVVIKPANNAGSRGVRMVKTKAGLKNAYREALKYARNKKVLIESFMEGVEVSVEAFVYGGEINIISLSDKVRTNPPYLLDTEVIFPSAYKKDVQQKIVEVAKKAIKAVGINIGPVHMELMMTKSGPVPVELAARGPGFKVFTEIMPMVTGIDLLEAQIKVALGLSPNLKRTKNYAAAISFFASPKAGLLKRISGVSKVNKLKGIHELDFYVKKGDKVNLLTCGDDRIGHVITYAKKYSQAKQIAETVNKLIRFEIGGQ